MLLRSLLSAGFAEARALGPIKALKHTWGSLRALKHPRQSSLALQTLKRLGADRWLPRHEGLFHLRHRHYLSQRLSLQQRNEAVLHHYRYEARTFIPSYQRLVYGGRGLVLWRAQIGGVDICMRLSDSSDMRWEGDLSAELFVDGTRVHIVSFVYVDAALFGLPSEPTMFITRNQSFRDEPGWSRFRAAYKHTVPSYFGLAAASGIATANGMRQFAAIGHDSQIACEPAIVETLKHSYDDFWRAFQAREIDGGHAFLLPAPMAAPAIESVKSKHRKRALERREAWAAVADSAEAAIVARLRGPDPAAAAAPLPTARIAPFPAQRARPSSAAAGVPTGMELSKNAKNWSRSAV